MLKVKAALVRCFRDWRRLLIGSVLAPIPVVNLLVTGYAVRAGASFPHEPYQLPPWRPLGPLFVDGIIVFLLSVIGALPVVLITQILFLLQDVIQNTRFLYILPLAYILILTYALPAIIVVYARTGSLRTALDLPRIYYSITTADYLKAWLAGYIGTLAIFIVGVMLVSLTGPTVILPYLLLGATLFIGQTFLLSMINDTYH